jgi:hypothetical protein
MLHSRDTATRCAESGTAARYGSPRAAVAHTQAHTHRKKPVEVVTVGAVPADGRVAAGVADEGVVGGEDGGEG